MVYFWLLVVSVPPWRHLPQWHTKNYMFMLTPISGVVLAQFNFLNSCFFLNVLDIHVIKFLIISPNCYQISPNINDSEFCQNLDMVLKLPVCTKMFSDSILFFVGFSVMKEICYYNRDKFNHCSSLIENTR